MNKKHNSELTNNSKILRKNMTKEEKHLWYDFLIKLPITVNRQKVIGKYIVDFYCSKEKTVIEIDGLQHTSDEGRQADLIRDEELSKLGIKVLRYSNESIRKNFKGVCENILKNLMLDIK